VVVCGFQTYRSDCVTYTFASRQGCNHTRFFEVRGGCVWESVLAITWTRAVISCLVNCCRRPVLTSLLAAAVLRPPGSANLIFHNIDIGDLPTPICRRLEFSTRSREFLFSNREIKFWRINILNINILTVFAKLQVLNEMIFYKIKTHNKFTRRNRPRWFSFKSK